MTMKTPRLMNCQMLLLLALFPGGNAVAERMYKWVDANGQVQYSNQLPPEAAQQKHELINQQGITVKVYRAPLTPEEKIEAKRLAELELKKQELAKKRANHDRSLLATYSSEKDMYRARDARIAALDSLIESTQSRIKMMQHKLLQATDDAGNYERGGKQPPASLLSEISKLRKQIKLNNEFSEDKKQEIEDIRTQFDSDIRRYRELTSEKPNADSKQKRVSALELAMKNPSLNLDRHDRTLLTAYATEDDLKFARDQEIGQMNASINESSSILDGKETQLSQISDNVSEYQDRNEIPPDSLLETMKQVLQEIETTQEQLKEKRSEKQALVEKFAADINRYRELTSGNPP
jgi:hypothetical protein